MNARILRLARRFPDGSRMWTVPGFPHAFKVVKNQWPGTIGLSWPATDSSGDPVRRGCRFDWHGKMAFREIRAILSRA